MATQKKPCLDHASFVGVWGPNPSTERGNHFHLGVHPREPKIMYPSGKFIVVRDVANPSDCFVYRGHNATTTVAKWSPNGYWVASADNTGKLRVWSWDNPEHALKIEIPGLGGAIKDLAWDPESKRIVVCGDGSTVNARVFMWDTGNNLGEVSGHSKRVVSCDYRPCRPFRVFTASEDLRTIFHKGPPFTMDHSNKDQHSNFINCVRFSPDGERAATCGSDYKVWLYDGKTGEPASQLPQEHTGSVYSLAWSPDSAKLVTASADKTVRLWDAASGACEHTWRPVADGDGNPKIGDMQVAAAFCGDQVVSVSLDGCVNLLDRAAEAPRAIVQAHQLSITAACPQLAPGLGGAVLTGSYDGVVCAWDPSTGLARRFAAEPGARGGSAAAAVTGAAHANKVSGIAVCSAGVVSVGWDDKLRLAPAGGRAYAEAVATNGQPVGVAADPSSDLVVVAATQGVMLFRGATPGYGVATPYDPTAVALLPGKEVAVGARDGKIHVYELTADGELNETATVEGHRGQVNCLAYSPDGGFLAAGDAAREVNVWVRGTWEAQVRGMWQFHTTSVTCLAWAPAGRLVASGGQDENVFVWSVDKPRRRVHYPFANKDGVSGLAWLSEASLVSAGADACLAKWDVAKDLNVFD